MVLSEWPALARGAASTARLLTPAVWSCSSTEWLVGPAPATGRRDVCGCGAARLGDKDRNRRKPERCASCRRRLPDARDGLLIATFFLALLGGVFLRLDELGVFLLVAFGLFRIRDHDWSPCRINVSVKR